MLQFRTINQGAPAANCDLSSAFLFGSDGVPLRADIAVKDGLIVCDKRAAGPAGMAILWPIKGVGEILVESTRLLEREDPYLLPVELARGHLMRINHKREEWGLFDAPELSELNARISDATDLVIAAFKYDDPREASAAGEQALALGVAASEALTRFHADYLLERRKETAGFSRRVFGCRIDPAVAPSRCGKLIADAFDFVSLPILWKRLEPAERSYDWKHLDAWIDWLTKNHIPVKGSNLICFDDESVPDWLYIWEHDFETIRDLVAEHIRRVVNRYGNYIQVWDVVSGLHAVQRFSFNFEQIMELTRLATTITKQLAPRSTTLLEIAAPWGEYYARNQRTIPPMLYLDMAVQSGINFDAIGLQFILGAGADGMYMRDMFQISSVIDRFGNFGRPIHVSAVQVPSSATPRATDPDDAPRVSAGGNWHGPWSEALQAAWLRAFCETALSRPFVETVTWRDLTDAPSCHLPHGGLVKPDLTPKKSYAELVKLRREIVPHAAP